VGFFNKYNFKVVLKNGFFFPIIVRGLGIFLNFFLTYYISRVHGIEMSGSYTVVFVLTFFLSSILKFGCDSLLVKVSSINEEKQNRAKTFGLYINVLVTCGLLALLVSGSLLLYWEQISFILGKDMRFSYNVFYTGLVLTPSVIISLNYEYLRGIGKNSLFFLFQSVLVPSFTLIFDVVFQAFFLSYSLAIYVTLLISFCFVYWTFRGIGFKSDSLRNYKSVFPNLFVGSFFIMLLGFCDVIILELLTDNYQVGVYSIVLKVSYMVVIGRMFVSLSMASSFSAFYAKSDYYSIISNLKVMNRRMFLPGLCFFLFFVFFGKMILNFFGPNMHQAYLALIIVSAGQLINCAMGAPETVMPMIGMEKTFRNIMLVTLPINIVINALLIPNYGYLGCAIASLITLAFWNLIGNFMMYRHIRKFISSTSITSDVS